MRHRLKIFGKIKRLRIKDKAKFGRFILKIFGGLYGAGIVINSVKNGISNSFNQTDLPLLELNPLKNITALFSKEGIGILLFCFIMYCLFTKKGYSLITGYKTIIDKKRGLEILPEGTHGTSNWINKDELAAVFNVGAIADLSEPLVGKLTQDGKNDYLGIKSLRGMNSNILIYGSPGTGKSHGFVKPFVLQAVERSESVILVDPKAEFYEAFSEYFRQRGYTVKVFNLLDRENSDGINCFSALQTDRNLVQTVAEIIIRNTSNIMEHSDFWEKSEKNLLMALLHYIVDLKDDYGRLLPIEERSLGTIYRLLSTCKIAEIDEQFRKLPKGHPALPPYGIFKQANPQILGNIIIGLGSRFNVYQDKLVDKITKYNDIDLELPGKEKCAYFCVISDQDSSMEFMSSMFFSLLFVRLSDYARKYGKNRRLPVAVNVILDEFCNTGKLIDFKKVLSTARSRGINIQIIIQSLAQLADRYPKMEWQEIVGNCDCQLFLGCNDQMTSEFISKQCGDMTVRVNNSMVPIAPLFSPVLSTTKPYTHNKTSTGRALMLPDEVRRLPPDESIVLVRGQKPAKLYKINPEEHPDYNRLADSKITDYFPVWKYRRDKDYDIDPDKFLKPYVPKNNNKSEYNYDDKPNNDPKSKPNKREYIAEPLPEVNTLGLYANERNRNE